MITLGQFDLVWSVSRSEKGVLIFTAFVKYRALFVVIAFFQKSPNFHLNIPGKYGKRISFSYRIQTELIFPITFLNYKSRNPTELTPSPPSVSLPSVYATKPPRAGVTFHCYRKPN